MPSTRKKYARFTDFIPMQKELLARRAELASLRAELRASEARTVERCAETARAWGASPGVVARIRALAK